MADLVNLGANVIAYQKGDVKYGMTCAWCMNCDYDQLLMLIGSQSDTGNNLKVGDKIGVSALSSNQKDIALHFGDNHSLNCDKFLGKEHLNKEGAILIPGAKNMMVCEVIAISYLKGNDEDHLIQVKVLETISDKDVHFLTRESM